MVLAMNSSETMRFAALLVRHESLSDETPMAERLGNAFEDVRLVVQDEVKAEVEDGERLGLLAQARDAFGSVSPSSSRRMAPASVSPVRAAASGAVRQSSYSAPMCR